MIHNPTERIHKRILVAVHCQGRVHWALVSATKIDNHYQVDQGPMRALIRAAQNGNTMRVVHVY